MKTQLLRERSIKLPVKEYKVGYRRGEREHIHKILVDISDNIKNNLTTVKGFAQLIRSKVSEGFCNEYFEIIDNEIEKIVVTVDSYRNNYRHK